MKKLLIPVLFISILYALYEQSQPHPNVYLMVLAIGVFLFCMIKLNNAIPARKSDEARSFVKQEENEQDNNEDHV